MKNFTDKVAVVTGGASGIGWAIAQRCAREGMKIVLADVEEKALIKAEEEMKANGADVISVQTDVSSLEDVEALASKTLETYGAIHLLINNAGVTPRNFSTWRSTMADWKWVLGVNLWGVIHGVQVFMPVMVSQGVECHIINTASIAGLAGGANGIYSTSKYGVVALSESLYYELAQAESKISVSVFCPYIINTQIINSERNRAADLQNEWSDEGITVKDRERTENLLEMQQQGMPPDEAVECVFSAIKEKRLYIISHPESLERVRIRMENILQRRNPAKL